VLYTTEKTRGSAGVLCLLVLACLVGGFGYSFGYATGHGRAAEQANDRLNQMWQFLAGDQQNGEADPQAQETSGGAGAGGYGEAPAPDTLGVADAHDDGRADG
jgi:hypothetical protein